MFKIKVNDLASTQNNRYKIFEPYEIKFELQPEFSDLLRKTIYHETHFSALRDAHLFSKQLAKFLYDSFFFVDLIYYRINALGIYNNDLRIENKKFFDYYIRIHQDRANVHYFFSTPGYAYQIITTITNFINSLIGILIFYKDNFKNEIENLFNVLINFKEYYIKTYRNSRELFNENSLKILW